MSVPHSPSSIRSRALRLLAAREYSRANLRQKLLRPPGRTGARRSDDRTGISDEDVLDQTRQEKQERAEQTALWVDQLLDEFEAAGWLSDERCAEQWVRQARERYGPRRVRQQLQAQGIGEELVQQSLASLESSEADDVAAVWARRFGGPPRDLREAARQTRFLLQRGYSPDAVSRWMKGLQRR